MKLRVVLLAVAAGLGGLIAGCGEGSNGKAKSLPDFKAPPVGETDQAKSISRATPPREAKKMPPSDPKREVKTSSGLKYEDIIVGSGETAKSGDEVEVHYTGWLANGTQFDSSLDRGKPLPFRLHRGGMIRGFDEGVHGMKIGGVRRLAIPSKLGYGESGMPPKIPPEADLVFEVELVKIK